MKDYKVEFIGNKGHRNYRTFDSMDKAMKFYNKLKGEAIIKKYNPETFTYDVVYDPVENIE